LNPEQEHRPAFDETGDSRKIFLTHKRGLQLKSLLLIFRWLGAI
jgi:hypothetical protein